MSYQPTDGAGAGNWMALVALAAANGASNPIEVADKVMAEVTARKVDRALLLEIVDKVARASGM